MSEDVALREADGIFVDVGGSAKVPPVYIIKNVLPSGIVFMAGPPKSMKSTALYLLTILVTGEKHRALPEEMMDVVLKGRVIGLSAEASAGEIRYALENGAGMRLEADGSYLVAEVPWEFRLDDPDALDKLLGWLEALRPRVFFIDPLRDFHSLEEKDDGGMNRLLRPIQKWAKSNDACAIIVHHTSKKQKGDNTNYEASEMRGTTALFGIADGVIMLTPKANGVIHMKATIKRGEPWERSVKLGVWGADTNVSVSQTAQDLLQHLQEADEKEPLTFDEVAKLMKVSKSNITLAARELVAAGLIRKEGRRYKVN